MPRPGFKRHRPNSKSPKGRAAKKDTSSPVVRLQQLAQKLEHKEKGERPENSDDSDKLVTRSKSTPRRNGTMQEVWASGAVAKGDKPGAYPTRAQRLQHLARDTQQVIKENIQRRSASGSKSASPLPAKSPSNVAHTHEEAGRASSQSAGTDIRRSATKSPQNSVSRPQQTPIAETSIMGTLKPRRRQASILHMIDNNDESTINPEDEEQFLPDDESTPVHANKAVTPSSASASLLSSSRKRKLGSDDPVQAANGIAEAETQASSSILVPDSQPSAHEPILPQQNGSASPRNKRARPSIQKAQDEDDIMAPPQSSSPEPSPERSIEPVPSKSEKPKASGPSTKDLQSLMPSKRRQGTRQRTQVNEFDIPEDSASPQTRDDDSVFLPRKKVSRKKEPTPRPKSASSATGKTSTRAKPKPDTDNNTSTTPATPRPSTIRTPLPLTRSINAENRKLRSPLLQTTVAKRTPMLKLNSNSQNLATTGKKEKQSGGSCLPSTKAVQPNTRSTRRTRQTEAMEDQENRNESAAYPAASLPEAITITSEDNDNILETIEHDSNTNDPKAERDRGRASTSDDDEEEPAIRTPAEKRLDKGKLKQESQWTNKWTDIDNWSLEYEEVSISTGSSSPGRR